MYLVHIYAYPYKYTYIQVLMAQNSCISQPYLLQQNWPALIIRFLRSTHSQGQSLAASAMDKIFPTGLTYTCVQWPTRPA